MDIFNINMGKSRQILHNLIHIWYLKSQSHKCRVELWFPGAGRWQKWKDVGRMVPTVSYAG